MRLIDRRRSRRSFRCHACVAALMLAMVAPAHGQSAPPPNPFLAASSWPLMHGGAGDYGMSAAVGPTAPSHRLTREEMRWTGLGPFSATAATFSSTYPNGRRAIIVGALQEVVKLDADTLQIISSYAVRPGRTFSSDEIGRKIDRYDVLARQQVRQPLYDAFSEDLAPALQDDQITNMYGLMTRENERLFFYKNPDSGRYFLQFYGDEREKDYDSPLTLKRQWEIPRDGDLPFIPVASNMTYDGKVVVVSKAGTVLVVSPDFTGYRMLPLAAQAGRSLDFMRAYVRNGIAVDDRGGIYVVTHDFLARVQWTGTELTMDPSKGAWKATYPEGARGSGTTPALMGWGKADDHLVAIADGVDDDPHIMVFWRDAIPSNWKGLPGYDRRVAGSAPVMFTPGKKARARIENSPVVKGYGIFAGAESPTERVSAQGSAAKQFVAEGLSGSLSGTAAIGGVKWEWNPRLRKLGEAWHTSVSLALSICAPDSHDVMYCVGRRGDEFTLEALNWETGESRLHYELGSSLRYYAYTPLVVTPDGAVDVLGWLGMLRLKPQGSPQ